MNATADELAGVVDLFGGLTRDELERALTEVAFRADGMTVDGDALEGALEEALESFGLVPYEPPSDADEVLLVAGPTAFPVTPEHAEDLPHILDVEPRRLDRKALGEQTRERFSRAVEDALEAGDGERASHLLDVSYDLEAWAPVDCASERDRLDGRLASR